MCSPPSSFSFLFISRMCVWSIEKSERERARAAAIFGRSTAQTHNHSLFSWSTGQGLLTRAVSLAGISRFYVNQSRLGGTEEVQSDDKSWSMIFYPRWQRYFSARVVIARYNTRRWYECPLRVCVCVMSPALESWRIMKRREAVR